jgi:hypothetical protein
VEMVGLDAEAYDAGAKQSFKTITAASMDGNTSAMIDFWYNASLMY